MAILGLFGCQNQMLLGARRAGGGRTAASDRAHSAFEGVGQAVGAGLVMLMALVGLFEHLLLVQFDQLRGQVVLEHDFRYSV